MATKTIYCGRFISAPHPGPNSALEIKKGAVLVSYPPPSVSLSHQPQHLEELSGSDSQSREAATAPTTTARGSESDKVGSESRALGALGDERGKVSCGAIIKRVDWTVSSPEEARERFGVGVEEAEVVNCGRQGFFFPGFVGESVCLFEFVSLCCRMNLGWWVVGGFSRDT